MRDIHIRYETPGAKPLADTLLGVIDDDMLQALRERNAARAEAARIALGDRWIGAVKVQRKEKGEQAWRRD